MDKETLIDIISVTYVFAVFLSPIPRLLLTSTFLLPLYVIFVLFLPFLVVYRLRKRLNVYANLKQEEEKQKHT